MIGVGEVVLYYDFIWKKYEYIGATYVAVRFSMESNVAHELGIIF